MKKAAATLLILLTCFAMVYPCAAKDVRFPAPSGFVNDYAGVLTGSDETVIEGLLRELERKTTAEIAVVTIKTAAPLTVEGYAVELFEKWGIGKKGKDNGILVLVAVDDRDVRIETGYGLEGAVTDLQSKMIIREQMVPAFKQGNYAQGIASAVVVLARDIGEEYGIELDLSKSSPYKPVHRKKRSPLSRLMSLLFLMLIFGPRFGPLMFLMGAGGGRSYWSGGGGGSFGGGFGGFGGGMSGGGGASGSW